MPRPSGILMLVKQLKVSQRDVSCQEEKGQNQHDVTVDKKWHLTNSNFYDKNHPTHYTLTEGTFLTLMKDVRGNLQQASFLMMDDSFPGCWESRKDACSHLRNLTSYRRF